MSDPKLCFIAPLFYKGTLGIKYKIASLAPLYLISTLRRNGFLKHLFIDKNVLYYNLLSSQGIDNFTKLSLADVRQFESQVDSLCLEKVKDFSPDFVGFTAYSGNMLDCRDCSHDVKEFNPDITTIIGGYHPTLFPKETLAFCQQVDFLVRGPGELPMLSLLKHTPPAEIPNTLYWNDGQIIECEYEPTFLPMDELPPPAFDLMDLSILKPSAQKAKATDSTAGSYKDDIEFKSDKIRTIEARLFAMLTSRGCVGRCNYCCSHLLYPKLSFQSTDYVIRQIQESFSYGLDYDILYFMDDMFLANTDKVEALSQAFIENGFQRRFNWICQSRPDAVYKSSHGEKRSEKSRAMLLAIKRAGCVRVEYGFESGSQRILDLMNKKTNVEDNLEVVRLTREAGLGVQANMILGYPSYTEEDFFLDLAFLEKTKPDVVSVHLLMPLPGTKVFDELLAAGHKISPYDAFPSIVPQLTDRFNFTSIPTERFIQLYEEHKETIYNADPERLKSARPENLLDVASLKSAVQRASWHPHYASCDADSIQTLSDFQAQVPKTEKSQLYNQQALDYIGKSHTRFKRISTSSRSGMQSTFRLIGDESIAPGMIQNLSRLFDLDKSTLVMNCYPLHGIPEIPGVVTVDVSVKRDTFAFAAHKLAPQFDQVLVVCQPNFLNLILDDLSQIARSGKKLLLVLGGAWISLERFEYILKRLDYMVDIISPFGIAEIGIGVGNTDISLHKYRRFLFNTGILDALLPEKFAYLRGIAPTLFISDLNKSHIESLDGEMCISSLIESQAIPVLRYLTGDIVAKLPTEHFPKSLLGSMHDFFFLWGKSDPYRGPETQPQIMDQIMYSNEEVARSLSGRYQFAGNTLYLESKSDGPQEADLESHFKTRLGTAVDRIEIRPLFQPPFNRDFLSKD